MQMTDTYFTAEKDLPTPRNMAQPHPGCLGIIRITTETTRESASSSAPGVYELVGNCNLHFLGLTAPVISLITSVPPITGKRRNINCPLGLQRFADALAG